MDHLPKQLFFLGIIIYIWNWCLSWWKYYILFKRWGRFTARLFSCCFWIRSLQMEICCQKKRKLLTWDAGSFRISKLSSYRLVSFKTNMNVFHGSTKLKGRKLQFNTMSMTNLFEYSHLHSYTEKLSNKLQSFKLY